MKLASFVPVGIILLVALAAAQESPRGGIFAGYSLEHVSACGGSGDTFLTCSQFIETGTSAPASYNGWEVSPIGFVYKFLGVSADFSGHYGTTTIHGNGLPSASVSRFSFMAGPVVALHRHNVQPFAHALFGGVFNRFGTFVSGEDTATVPNYTKFVWAIGGGIDGSIGRHLAVRVLQFDYERVNVPSADGGSYPAVNGFRIATGIVFRP